MRGKLIIVIAGVLVLVGGIAYGVSRPLSDGEVHGLRPAPNCRELSPACPEVLPPIVLELPWAEDAIGFRFEPPPADADPSVDAEEAVNIAWQEGGVDGLAQQATLALVPRGGQFPADALVWIVRYDGHCLTPVGAYSDSETHEGKCFYQPFFTIIDAGSGEFIMSWTRPT
jgi:hypothetical protein